MVQKYNNPNLGHFSLKNLGHFSLKEEWAWRTSIL